MSGEGIKTSLAYDRWLEMYEEEKKKMPEVGTILRCENVEDEPAVVQLDDERKTLHLGVTLSIRILNDKNEVQRPYWVLVKDGGKVKGTMKAIVQGATKEVYLGNKDHLKVVGFKITGIASSRLSILGHLLYEDRA